MSAVLVRALSNPQVRDTLAKGACETAPSTPAELATEISSAYKHWGRDDQADRPRQAVIPEAR